MIRKTVVTCSLAAVAVAATPALLQMPEMPQPTAEHARVLEGVGTWEGTLTSYMTDAPETMEARETVVPVGGFWTQARFECDFMGQPYVGTGCTGYDPERKKYVGTWIDSMSSHLAIMEGELDRERGVIVMHWDAPGPMGEMVPHRMEIDHQTDSYTCTFFMGEGGDEVKSMVISMDRTSSGVTEASSTK